MLESILATIVPIRSLEPKPCAKGMTRNQQNSLTDLFLQAVGNPVALGMPIDRTPPLGHGTFWGL